MERVGLLPLYSLYIIIIFFRKDVRNIQNKKNYYNQNYIIKEIHKDTGYPTTEIMEILGSLENSVKCILSDNSEIKLFPGLKIKSKYIPRENFKSNLGINNNCILMLNAEFSNYFKKTIKKKHIGNI